MNFNHKQLAHYCLFVTAFLSFEMLESLQDSVANDECLQCMIPHNQLSTYFEKNIHLTLETYSCYATSAGNAVTSLRYGRQKFSCIDRKTTILL